LINNVLQKASKKKSMGLRYGEFLSSYLTNSQEGMNATEVRSAPPSRKPFLQNDTKQCPLSQPVTTDFPKRRAHTLVVLHSTPH
jgi:hypothetical protein